MRIAHLSDLHLIALAGAVPGRLLNKRLTGYVNLKLRRGHQHHLFAARAVMRAIRARGDIDHVVVTGDVSNLALEAEFELVAELLRQDLGMAPSDVSLVPGNHDAYTRGAHREGRFARYFGPYLSNDLPDGSGVVDAGPFPYVRLRGPAAIIGLSTAVPRPPFIASGELGRLQRLTLHSLVNHAEVRRRVPVILQHHPWHAPSSRVARAMEGLRDAADEDALLAGLDRGLLLHGHLHRRVRRPITTSQGQLEAVCATSASLVHDDPDRMCGFNVYEISDDGGLGLQAYRLVVAGERFVPASVPTAP